MDATSKPKGRRVAVEVRRDFLKSALGTGIGLVLAGPAAAGTTDDPTRVRPKAGDQLVFFGGERDGQPIAPADLPLGGPQVLAYPVDPLTQTVRNGSRLNQVLLVRFEPEQLADDTRKRSAEGVVAYSAVCTHQGCPVSMWKADQGTLFCACHGSQFDPKDGARKVDGPAPRRLARLPLGLEGGRLVVAGAFMGRVGFKKK